VTSRQRRRRPDEVRDLRWASRPGRQQHRTRLAEPRGPARKLHRPAAQGVKGGDRPDVDEFADMLSDQDMLDVAAYFSTQKPTPKGGN
jgi:cytochrome c553